MRAVFKSCVGFTALSLLLWLLPLGAFIKVSQDLSAKIAW